MVKTETVVCDFCGGDITTSGVAQDYRIVLMSEPKQHVGLSSKLVRIEPSFPKPLHFCGDRCLVRWAVKTYRLAIEQLLQSNQDEPPCQN